MGCPACLGPVTLWLYFILVVSPLALSGHFMPKLKGKKWALKNGLDNEPRTPDSFAVVIGVDIYEILCLWILGQYHWTT